MDKEKEEQIIKDIIQKKKQGVEEKQILNFLENSGYPVRFLDEANRRLSKGVKEKEESGLTIKVIGLLFIISSAIEAFYFSIIIPDKALVIPEAFTVPAIFLALFTLLSFAIGFGFFKEELWAFNYGTILLFLRMVLLGYFAAINNLFFVFLIMLNLILLAIILILKPSDLGNKLQKEQYKMMEYMEKRQE